MTDGIQCSELLEYLRGENQRWIRFFARHPQELDLPLDLAGGVRKLILHIFAVELFFANAVSGNPQVDVEKFPNSSLDDLFGISRERPTSTASFLPTRSQKTGPKSYA